MRKILCLLIFFLASFWLSSQCAMCRENLKYDIENGAGIGANINSGILYIMLIPYLLMLVIGIILYRNYKQKPQG